jgi:hypothetical protein
MSTRRADPKEQDERSHPSSIRFRSDFRGFKKNVIKNIEKVIFDVDGL